MRRGQTIEGTFLPYDGVLIRLLIPLPFLPQNPRQVYRADARPGRNTLFFYSVMEFRAAHTLVPARKPTTVNQVPISRRDQLFQYTD